MGDTSSVFVEPRIFIECLQCVCDPIYAPETRGKKSGKHWEQCLLEMPEFVLIWKSFTESETGPLLLSFFYSAINCLMRAFQQKSAYKN